VDVNGWDIHLHPFSSNPFTSLARGGIHPTTPQHPFLRESVEDVKSFLCIAGRKNKLSEFAAKLADATARSDLRYSRKRSLQFW
jgi:hypothetical protein